MRASETAKGMVIDMRHVASEYGEREGGDPYHIAHFAYALVEADAAPAEPVAGKPAVLIFTDQGNYKLPADYDIPFINYDGAES